ncbi:MAG: replication initiator protein [Microviridae sp.]|nr:MAG: replication initiator protein [Microviridae sp.]
MLCKKPYRQGIEAHPCGRCAPCLVNRQQQWSVRCTLESYLWGNSIFITLTYDDESLPKTQKELKRSVQLWLKRFRKALPQKIRYFIALEYGKQGRAHFHGIIFNASQFDAKALQDTWGMGFTHVGECNPKTINYVTKYITKGDSRAKEDSGKKTFAIMSRNKGIGYGAVQVIGKSLLAHDSVTKQIQLGDVPKGTRVSSRIRPLGRYLTGKLRLATGHASHTEPESVRRSRLNLEAESARRSGTIRFLQRDANRRNNDQLTAEARIKIAASKEKL